MITPTGENLNVLILAEVAEDWQAFATWYSFYKNAPDANVILAISRNAKIEFQFYQWAKRLQVPHFYQNLSLGDELGSRVQAIVTARARKLVTENVLLIKPLTMLTAPLDEKILNPKGPSSNDYAWFINKINTRNEITECLKFHDPQTDVCIDVKSNDVSSLVNYSKGCGRWVDTMKGCPFANASSLSVVDMTVNEIRIVELWRSMAALYSAVL